MQPQLKARIVGNRTTTFALQATACSTASTAPVSSAGGPDHGGISGNALDAVSSPNGEGSKDMTSRYAARADLNQRPRQRQFKNSPQSGLDLAGNVGAVLQTPTPAHLHAGGLHAAEFVLEFLDLVADAGGDLELQLGRGGVHLVGELADQCDEVAAGLATALRRAG
jgi:hypothetical protein